LDGVVFSISGAVSVPGSQTGNDRIFRRFFAKNYEIRAFILFFVHPIVSPDKPVATGFFCDNSSNPVFNQVLFIRELPFVHLINIVP